MTTHLTKALGLDKTVTTVGDQCRHEWVQSFPWGDDGHAGAQECARCGIKWADAMRGFGSNVQPLSGRVKRVVRK